MGGTKCLRLGTCELECMGGVLQNDSSISKGRLNTPEGASAREPQREAHAKAPRNAWRCCAFPTARQAPPPRVLPLDPGGRFPRREKNRLTACCEDAEPSCERRPRHVNVIAVEKVHGPEASAATQSAARAGSHRFHGRHVCRAATSAAEAQAADRWRAHHRRAAADRRRAAARRVPEHWQQGRWPGSGLGLEEGHLQGSNACHHR